MASIWAPVIAALGASLLTTIGLLARDRVLSRRKAKEARLSAYDELVTHSMVVLHTATALRVTMQIRSGLREGIDVALHHRRPLEPLDVADRLSRDLQPLLAAWTRVCGVGSRESIPLANDLLDTCIRLITVAMEPGRAGGAVSRYVLGERWTSEQDERLNASHLDVGKARRRLMELRRREGGLEAADLLPVTERLKRADPSTS